MKTSHPLLILSLLCSSSLFVACGQPEQGDASPALDMSPQEDMSNTSAPDAAGQDAPQDLDTSSTDQGDEPDAATSEEVPSNAEELFKYLQDRSYSALPAEPAVHASTGPHGRVRTFVNPTLADSIEARATAHPVGSASIKELYSSADELRGWAVSVKLTDSQGDGNDWYWYEVFSTTTNNPVVDGVGVGSCTGCHSGGTDLVLTPGPFTR